MVHSYVAVPAKLKEPDFDFSSYSSDDEVLKAIEAIRKVYLRNSPIEPRASRSLRGFSWIKAHWVNGDTYSNKEKAMAAGTMLERALKLTNAIDSDEPVEFNDAVVPGGNEKTADKTVAVKVFSIHNKSRRNIEKQCMDLADVHELCDWFKCDQDDTMLLIFKRGEKCVVRSEHKKRKAHIQIQKGSIIEGNHFLNDIDQDAQV